MNWDPQDPNTGKSKSLIHIWQTTMSDTNSLVVEIVAPNGLRYEQPRGLFINNEFAESSTGETIVSLDPA